MRHGVREMAIARATYDTNAGLEIEIGGKYALLEIGG